MTFQMTSLIYNIKKTTHFNWGFFYCRNLSLKFLISCCLDSIISFSLSICSSPFSDKSIANGRVSGILARTILIITIIGTDRIIQTTHHKAHQNERAIIITRGDRFNLFHMKRGSIILPIRTCIQMREAVMNIKG